jgi:hypothetical protein
MHAEILDHAQFSNRPRCQIVAWDIGIEVQNLKVYGRSAAPQPNSSDLGASRFSRFDNSLTTLHSGLYGTRYANCEPTIQNWEGMGTGCFGYA